MVDKTTGVRVLFTGPYWPGANARYIAHAFERCGAVVRVFNDTAFALEEWTSIRGKIARQLLQRTVVEPEWNQQLLDLVMTYQPDLLYITNGHLCQPKTLKIIQQASIPMMCFYHDVRWQKIRGSHFSENMEYFDLIATTRSWQKPLFAEAGAKEITVVRFGYEPSVYRPVEPSLADREHYQADVSFVGTMEMHRTADLTELVANDFPYTFRLWGALWDHLSSNSFVRKYWQGRTVFEHEIPLVYAMSKVALHWVGWDPHSQDIAMNKGDQHNSRTFQIAACGGALMMAQRTDEHRQFFQEDVEAVYFDDVNELRQKLAYWLDPARDGDRKAMAAAARARCVAEDYSYVPIARSFLKHFGLSVLETRELG